MKHYAVEYQIRIEEVSESGHTKSYQMKRTFNTSAKRALCVREIVSRCKRHATGLKGYFVGYLGSKTF